jgi:Putative beta-barrel porin 2
MKRQLCLLSAASLAVLSSSASAQGLLSLGQRDEFEKKLPFSVTVGVGAGWDSNVNLSSNDEQDSGFIKGTIIAEYSTGDRRTSYSFGLTYNPFYYLDAPEGMDDFQQSASVNFSLRHRVNPRLTITDSLYFAYEYEPNYQIGTSVARRTEPYIYGYNNLNVAYAWTKRFSTVTGYTISGIDYDDDSEAGENYLSHLFSQDFRYALSKVTTAVLTYRYGITEYDNNFGDYSTQYFLGGLDHSFSRRTIGSFRAGAEIRDRDNGGSETSPYAEASFSHSVAKQTYVRWYGRYGFEDSDIGGFTERSSFRTGVSVQQRFTNRLAGNLGANYIFDQFEGGGSDFDDNVIEVSVGLDFNVYRNLVLNAGYSFTSNMSDEDLREYDRHILSLGMTAKF